MRLDELFFEILLERRTTIGSSSGRIMHLVPVFILETHNQTNYKMFPRVRPDGRAVNTQGRSQDFSKGGHIQGHHPGIVDYIWFIPLLSLVYQRAQSYYRGMKAHIN